MKNTNYLLILLCTTLGVACKHDRPIQQQHTAVNVAQSEARPFDTESIFNTLLILEDSIRQYPDNKTLIQRFVATSFDTVSGCFFVVGKGVANPDFPEGARDASKTRAANFNAQQWTLYCKAWHTGSMQTFGKTISGNIYYSEIVSKREVGDTLLVLVKVPVGSVVLD